MVRAAQGQLDDSLNDFDEAAKANPEDPEIYIARGCVLMDKGDFRNAFDEFNLALVRRPNDPTALARRGLAWNKRGNIESALADLNQAISLNPAEPSFYVWRGMAWSATNQFDKALADMDHAVQLGSNAPGVYASRAYVFSKRREYVKSTADFAHGLQLNPASPELLNGLAWLRATCAEAGFRDGKEALQLATHACELTGFKNPSYLDTLAAAYAESGDFVQAVKYQEQALALLPTNLPSRPRYQEHLAAFRQKQPFREVTK